MRPAEAGWTFRYVPAPALRDLLVLGALALLCGGCWLPPSPPDFGEGFADVTPDFGADPPFPLCEAAALHEACATWGVLADLDEDGAPELIVSAELEGGFDSAVYARGAGGGWQRLAPVWPGRGVSAAADFDGDGRVDLLSVDPIEMRWGEGGGAFAEPELLAPFGLARGYAVAVADLDSDGWLDLGVADVACGGDSAIEVLRRTGPRTYEAGHATVTAPPNHHHAYAAFAGPVGSRGVVLASIGSTCEPGPREIFFERGARGPDGLFEFTPFDPFRADASFRSSARPGESGSLGTRAPMGAAAADVDGDGLQDFIAALDADLTLFVQRDGELVEAAPEIWISRNDQGDMLPWGTALVDFDRDGRTDVLSAHGNDFGQWFDEPIGPQWTTAHWNGGGLRFADVSELLGIAQRGQWRALTRGDLEGDGDVDLIVGGMGVFPRVYENRVSGGHGLALRLTGPAGTSPAMGARVEVRSGGRTQHFQVTSPASPLAWSEPLVFAGLGEATEADVTITWPSGEVQEHSGLTAGRVHAFSAPALFEVEPASRHLPADGAAIATLRIRPGAGAGNVELRRLSGAASLASVQRDGEAWVARVQAPRQAGSAVFEIVVDGEALPIAPRLHFDGP